jgi:hypothetical protein
MDGLTGSQWRKREKYEAEQAQAEDEDYLEDLNA